MLVFFGPPKKKKTSCKKMLLRRKKWRNDRFCVKTDGKNMFSPTPCPFCHFPSNTKRCLRFSKKKFPVQHESQYSWQGHRKMLEVSEGATLRSTGLDTTRNPQKVNLRTSKFFQIPLTQECYRYLPSIIKDKSLTKNGIKAIPVGGTGLSSQDLHASQGHFQEASE